jgi:hypothetical protein
MSVSIRRTDSDRRIGLDERRRGMVAAYVLLGVFAVSGCSLAVKSRLVINALLEQFRFFGVPVFQGLNR